MSLPRAGSVFRVTRNEMSGGEVRQRMTWAGGIALGMVVAAGLGSSIDNFIVGGAVGLVAAVVFYFLMQRVGQSHRKNRAPGREVDAEGDVGTAETDATEGPADSRP